MSAFFHAAFSLFASDILRHYGFFCMFKKATRSALFNYTWTTRHLSLVFDRAIQITAIMIIMIMQGKRPLESVKVALWVWFSGSALDDDWKGTLMTHTHTHMDTHSSLKWENALMLEDALFLGLPHHFTPYIPVHHPLLHFLSSITSPQPSSPIHHHVV